jgi:hypothetical protein
MQLENYIGLGLVVIIGGYWIYHTRVIRHRIVDANKDVGEVRKAADEQNERVKRAIEVSLENTQAALEQTSALRETNALLRELIAVNREMLEQKHQANS